MDKDKLRGALNKTHKLNVEGNGEKVLSVVDRGKTYKGEKEKFWDEWHSETGGKHKAQRIRKTRKGNAYWGNANQNNGKPHLGSKTYREPETPVSGMTFPGMTDKIRGFLAPSVIKNTRRKG